KVVDERHQVGLDDGGRGLDPPGIVVGPSHVLLQLLVAVEQFVSVHGGWLIRLPASRKVVRTARVRRRHTPGAHYKIAPARGWCGGCMVRATFQGRGLS